jgi:hypothetical protein
MDKDTQKSLILGVGAVAGGWGGAVAAGRIGAAYGYKFGPMGTVAGAAVGALLGLSLCKMLLPEVEQTLEDIEGEFEVAMEESA